MTKIQMIKRVAASVAILAGMALPAHAAQTTFNFGSGGFSSTIGPYGNTRSFTGSDGTTNVITEGWSTTGSSGTLQTGWLGQYGSYGLGVTNRAEGTGSYPSHTVDNLGATDLVAFTFNQAVAVTSAFLTAFSENGGGVLDSDISIWIGNVNNAYTNGGVDLSGLSLADLVSTLGLTKLPTNTGGNTSTRTADFNAGLITGNILLISAANPNPDNTYDAFKIGSLTDTIPNKVPEPGILTIFGLGLLGLAMHRRQAMRRRYAMAA